MSPLPDRPLGAPPEAEVHLWVVVGKSIHSVTSIVRQVIGDSLDVARLNIFPGCATHLGGNGSGIVAARNVSVASGGIVRENVEILGGGCRNLMGL